MHKQSVDVTSDETDVIELEDIDESHGSVHQQETDVDLKALDSTDTRSSVNQPSSPSSKEVLKAHLVLVSIHIGKTKLIN